MRETEGVKEGFKLGNSLCGSPDVRKSLSYFRYEKKTSEAAEEKPTEQNV